jgi:hypothetical protein
MQSRLRGDELEFNCIVLEEKETHNRIEALIKRNSKFYIPLIQTDGSEI